ncbi:cysteine hydrolase [uncultured Hoeflea sp.]|uniref:cysteine hydrolase family protein n=1 Tax=uncultured Hoeflea sp. TaxID=538666 RepID=UPI002619BAF7|nr:cysteine hydrolase [uncultured Hoeflea sp.]
MEWLYGLVAIVAALAIYTLWGMIRLQTPTRGPLIDRATRPGEALVIVDVQRDFTATEETYAPDMVEAAIGSINTLADRFHQSGAPVLNIRHVFKGPYVNFLVRLLSGGRGAAGSSGLGPDPRLTHGHTADFIKHRGDAFSNPAFGQWLGDHAIGKLVIVGLDGNACVKSTADGALNRGYEVEIIDAAVLAQSGASWAKQKNRLVARGAVVTA